MDENNNECDFTFKFEPHDEYMGMSDEQWAQIPWGATVQLIAYWPQQPAEAKGE